MNENRGMGIVLEHLSFLGLERLITILETFKPNLRKTRRNYTFGLPYTRVNVSQSKFIVLFTSIVKRRQTNILYNGQWRFNNLFSIVIRIILNVI